MTAPAFPTPPDVVPVRRALISVSDKAGLIDTAKALSASGIELVSTGGTRAAIAAAGLPVKDISELTGFPEMMDGRVKTLHPVVHGGLLGVRDAPEHAAAMTEHGIGGIDLLYVNLYPFEATVGRGGDFAECVENIDIGGPAMIRSAAKNHGYVAVCTAPEGHGGRGGGAEERRHDPRPAPSTRRPRLCPHRRLRRGDLGLVRRPGGRRLAGPQVDLGPAEADHALR